MPTRPAIMRRVNPRPFQRRSHAPIPGPPSRLAARVHLSRGPLTGVNFSRGGRGVAIGRLIAAAARTCRGFVSVPAVFAATR